MSVEKLAEEYAYNNTQNHCPGHLKKSAADWKAGYKAGESNALRWRKVEDELPGEYTKVLCKTVSNDYQVLRFEGKNSRGEYIFMETIEEWSNWGNVVTEWMPIPGSRASNHSDSTERK